MPSEKEFKVNDYITIKLLQDNKTHIFINNKRYIQCLRLVLTLQEEFEFDSIDQMQFSSLRRIDNDHEKTIDITIEEEFMAHCSNLQAWAENYYDTNLLHRSIAFSLLKKLYEVGDPIAKKTFISEIKKRCEEGHPRAIFFLIEDNYMRYLGDDWFVDQLNNPDSKVVENLIKWIEKNSMLHYLPALDIFSNFSNYIHKKNERIIYKKIKKVIYSCVDTAKLSFIELTFNFPSY